MKYLYDEYPLLVFPTLAVMIGLHEAIVLQQIHYWCNISRKEIDGRLWTFNSCREWQKQFPFWTQRTIQNIIANLEEKKLLISGNFNEKKSDRTKWYTINYEKFAEVSSAFDNKITNDYESFSQCISSDISPDINVINNINESEKTSKPESTPESPPIPPNPPKPNLPFQLIEYFASKVDCDIKLLPIPREGMFAKKILQKITFEQAKEAIDEAMRDLFLRDVLIKQKTLSTVYNKLATLVKQKKLSVLEARNCISPENENEVVLPDGKILPKWRAEYVDGVWRKKIST